MQVPLQAPAAGIAFLFRHRPPRKQASHRPLSESSQEGRGLRKEAQRANRLLLHELGKIAALPTVSKKRNKANLPLAEQQRPDRASKDVVLGALHEGKARGRAQVENKEIEEARLQAQLDL